MTIYITPYDVATLRPTSLSTDSGLESLDQVVEIMGEPTERGQRWVAYDEMAYSEIPFYLGECGHV